MHVIEPHHVVQSHSAPRRIRTLRLAFSLMFFGSIFVAILSAGALFLATIAGPFADVDASTLYRAAKQLATESIGESPHVDKVAIAGPTPICRTVPSTAIKPLKRAFSLMRGTEEGDRLYAMLLDTGICVTVDDLPYNAAYAESRRTFPDDWSTSRIVVDRSLVVSSQSDVLAAVLIHEATHIDRAVTGEACFVDDNCKRLANGVEIDEELAAHTAEAEFWLELFGSDGKRFAFGTDYSENRLLRAYLRGDADFRTYVTALRSDPHEGEGI